MPAVPLGAFARKLQSLDTAELAAFVADLWAARGFRTRVEGPTVLAERDRGRETRRIWCGNPGPAADSERPDIVIDAAGDGTDTATAQVIGPEELRDMLLYAVDRETADRLFRNHFGRSLDAAPASTPLRYRLSGTLGGQLLLVSLITVMAVVMALSAPGIGPTFGDAGDAAVSVPPDVTVTPGAVIVPARTDSERNRPQGGGDLFRYPPGIGATGVTDADALAAAHRTALSDARWELRLVHNRSHDLVHPFHRWRTVEQSVVRLDHTRYRYEVNGLARVGNASIASVTYADYGDGTANYRRLIGLHGHAFKRTQLPTERPPGVFATVSAAYVQRFLATTQSRVEPVRIANTTRTRVIATGTPTAMARTVANYTAVAVVDRRGVVHSLSVQYTLLRRVPEPTPNGIATPYASPADVPTEPIATVRFEMVLRDLGTTTLAPPNWYETAINATNASGLPPWPNDPAV